LRKEKSGRSSLETIRVMAAKVRREMVERMMMQDSRVGLLRRHQSATNGRAHNWITCQTVE
jgi:RecA/RadA recombinase